MDHAIYTAMGAASQTLDLQSVTASNMANASTPGFRKQLEALRAVPVQGLSLPTRTLVAASTPGADMTPGSMDYTGRSLDVAIQQDGWLAVRSANGQEAYTRNGNMQISPTGQLTINGDPVMGDDGPGLYVPEAIAEVLKEGLLPLADYASPNPFEIGWLTGQPIRDLTDLSRAARALRMAPGGHLIATGCVLADTAPGMLESVIVGPGGISRHPVPRLPVGLCGRRCAPT